MLSIFRHKGLSSVVYGVVIVATVLVFVIQFRPNAGQRTASLKEACVVLVKGHCVNPKSFKAAYRLLIPRDQSGNLLTARARSMGLGRITADGLVERELLVSEGERIGVRATPDEVDAEILNGFIHVSVPSDNPSLAYNLRVGDGRIYAGFKDQKTKQFDYKVYERSIRMMTGKSATEFKEEQERELVASKMRDLVRSPVRVSEGEALETYLGEKSHAKVTHVEVKTGWAGRWAVPVTAGELDSWMKDKANEALVNSTFDLRKKDSVPVKDHIRHILVKVAPDAGEESKALALGRIAKAFARIKAGEAFATVARDVSDDTGSAAHGGDVGDKTEGFVEPFKVAANALKPGEMTPDAIETQFGYHVILKDDPAKSADVEAQLKKDTVRSLFVKTKALEAAKSVAARISADMKAGKSADDAIKEAILPYVKAPETLPAVAVRGASAEKSDAGATAASDGGADAKKPRAILPKAPTAETDPDHPKAETSASFNQGGEAIPTLSGDASSQVTRFAFAGKDGDLMPEPLRSEDGFMVVQLKEHKSATKEEFDKDRDIYVQTLLAQKQAEALALYVKRLKESAKADYKIDESYTKEQGGKDGGAPTEEEDEGP